MLEIQTANWAFLRASMREEMIFIVIYTATL